MAHRKHKRAEQSLNRGDRGKGKWQGGGMAVSRRHGEAQKGRGHEEKGIRLVQATERRLMKVP